MLSRCVGVEGVRVKFYALIVGYEAGRCCKRVGALAVLALNLAGFVLLAYFRVPKTDREGVLDGGMAV